MKVCNSTEIILFIWLYERSAELPLINVVCQTNFGVTKNVDYLYIFGQVIKCTHHFYTSLDNYII